MTMRSTPMPSSIRRSRMRSWVIGRCVTTPWRANAMAVASTAPMKIGSTRWSPSASRSNTIGLFVGSSTRTPTRCISTIGRTLPPEQRSDVRVGVVPQRSEVALDDHVEVPIAALEVEAVAEEVHVAHVEAAEAHRGRNDPPHGSIEQHARLQRAGFAPRELAEQVRQRESRVDDVLDEDHVASAHVDVEVFQQSHATGAGGVRRDGEEVDDGVDGHGADQVGKERNAALEDRDE